MVMPVACPNPAAWSRAECLQKSRLFKLEVLQQIATFVAITHRHKSGKFTDDVWKDHLSCAWLASIVLAVRTWCSTLPHRMAFQ